MKVRDIMTSEGLASASLDTTLEEIASMMKEHDVGAIPIVDEDEKLAGIITDRDIVVRAIADGQEPSSCTAEDILSEQLQTIGQDADIEEAADLMARHKIRRLPVAEDGVIVGMLSLGDISVKSEDEQAAEALEDISEGVRPSGGKAARNAQNGGRQARSQNGGRQQQQSQNRGATQRAGNADSQFNAAGRSPGEQVAAEEAEYERNAQRGGSRAESKLSGRTSNQSKSQQTIANDLVNVEGEEEPEYQNAGGGQARQRANKEQPTARGKQSTSTKGRDTGQGRNAEQPLRGKAQQGVSNRSSAEEKKRQQKVTPMRAEAANPGRNRAKKRAS